MPGASAAGCLLGVIRMNRPARWAALVLALVAVAALAFWAGRVTLTPPAQAEQRPAASALVTVAEQELGRVITLGVSVSREQTPAAVNALTGVVTRAGESGEVAAGEVLYAVAQKPVLVLQGELPQWRPLGEGTSGDDVAAFQRMLAATGAKVEATGTWDEATADAWDDWLTERGYPAADTVELGQLVVLDALPAPLSVDAKTTAVGTTLAGGENVVARPGDQPDFALEVNQEQAALIPAGTQVTVPHGEHEWKAVAGESTSDEQGLIRITLTAPDGGVVCGEDCDTLPADATTSLLSQVSVVPPVSGPVVPVSALRTQPDGAATVTVVRDGAAEDRTVTVLGSADGLAVEDLRFAYTRAAEELFDGLTHAFTPGAVTALTGPSGRGKSTLLYVLGLMLTPTSGVVRLGDVDASTRPDRERSRLRATSVGFVFQDSELDPSRPILDSVVEPGLYAGLERQTLEDRARALLERFGLAHRADHRPGQVSGGQAQRVAVCRALVNAPVVVLADEPTGNLDPDNAGLVMDALADAAAEGRTVVVATHDPAVVARADEVVRL